MDRRSFLIGMSLATATGCTRCERDQPNPNPNAGSAAGRALADAAPSFLPPVLPPEPSLSDSGLGIRGQVKTETWTLPNNGRAVTIVPAWTPADEKLPMLIALHGRGEANKGPDLGVMGWPKDYALLKAIERVCSPPLTTEDFETFVDESRLRTHNDILVQRQFAGIVIVCPYSWDVDLRKPAQMKEYSDYVMKNVVPRARKELPVLDTPGALGIDGVSLGGALSLRIGLGNPEMFGAVGTLQAAIGEDQVPEYTELAKSARAKNPKLKLRLLTSKDDYFKRAIKATSAAWTAANIRHDFEEVPGPHDYPFNRGPGAIEMLLWHDVVLARA